MSGWDKGEVYHADLLRTEPAPESDYALKVRAREFFENFRIQQQYVYREQIAGNVAAGLFYVTVELEHVQAFDEELCGRLVQSTGDTVQALERAARDLARQFWTTERVLSVRDPFADFQVRIVASLQSSTMAVRHLDSVHVGRFVRIPGIVVSTSTVVNRPTRLHLQCKSCSATLPFAVSQYGTLGPINIPASCPGARQAGTDVQQPPCPRDSMAVVPEKCQCVDQQTIKLQEVHDVVPVGELPRHVILIADRSLANSVQAGSRIVVNGIYSIFSAADRGSSNAPALRTPFVRVLGIESDGGSGSAGGRSQLRWSEAEERQMQELCRSPDFFERFTRSIAPPIFGCEDIKKALACLLFGGTRRILPDRVRLRGDINVLLLGDPGMAKSQFLKFIERVAPVSVYTSGKGSSAAGLTASVIRDPASGDFYLEGGAMVLADGGVCCIDEFDKMNEEDRVAIHEAMEQQTISIAKAGITTVLNSRTSVLAAANPAFGRYDDLKSPGDNIDFGTTILSRFDMIFIMRDEHNMQRDATMARHVLSIHQNAAQSSVSEGSTADFDLPLMKKLIAYCRAYAQFFTLFRKCQPRLSPEAAEKLISHYVSIRSQVQRFEQETSERSSIPITIRYFSNLNFVRQLEAIIRIAEALAKMSLNLVASEAHVDEALRLFRVSTMQAVISGHSLEGMARPDLLKQVDSVERALRQRLPVGTSVPFGGLVREMVDGKGFAEHSVIRAIDIMVQQERLALRQQRKVVVRIR